MQDVLSRARENFEEVLLVLEDDLATIKTGRAKPDLLENIMVEAYEGQPKMKLLELSSISVPDPRQLVVKPWDQNVIEPIETAIRKSDLGLNPVVDGDMIRINIPALTEDRRKDMVKLVKQKLEGGRVLLRQARQETKEVIDSKKGKSDISEDDIFKAIEDLNKLTDEYVVKIDEMGVAKEKELMTV